MKAEKKPYEKKRRKFGVNRNVLLITAGIVWIVAGANILRIGIITWSNDTQHWLAQVCGAILIFLVFFNFVFKRLFYKHTKRIEQKSDDSCPFSFFDAKGWIVMVVMILFGILARKYHLLPNSFIAVFYTGLSSALIITGILFLYYWWHNKPKI